jgi:signal transduction histidine kinase
MATRTQTLAAVSHDLKTPLTRMRLRAETLADRAQAEGLIRDIREMERMLDQTLAHLRGERKDEERRPLDLVSLLTTLVDEAVDQGAAAMIEPSAPIVLPVRPLALKRAFGNLIDNAVKYGGGVRVKLADAGEAIRIEISDGGPGIPEERMAEMFQPFTRLEPSRNPETGGFGLGLSIAKDIIEGHSGAISLHNRPDGGLLVRIDLPKINPATP